VRELFATLEKQGGKITASVTLYMLELYQVGFGGASLVGCFGDCVVFCPMGLFHCCL
jgi:hypothetical protein